MKKNNNAATDMAITCVIGANTEITGDIKTKEPIRIEGSLTGNIISESLVILGAGAAVTGNITALSFCTGGKTKGDITVSERLEALSTANIKGNITAKTLIIDENAYFDGNCHMIRTEEAEPAQAKHK